MGSMRMGVIIKVRQIVLCVRLRVLKVNNMTHVWTRRVHYSFSVCVEALPVNHVG